MAAGRDLAREGVVLVVGWRCRPGCANDVTPLADSGGQRFARAGAPLGGGLVAVIGRRADCADAASAWAHVAGLAVGLPPYFR